MSVMDAISSIVRPQLHRCKSDPSLGTYHPRTEIVGLVVPEKSVAILLQAPATRRLMLNAPHQAAVLAAAFAEAAYFEKTRADYEKSVGLQAVLQSAAEQAHAMRHHSDNCKAEMRQRRNSGRSELQFSNHCSIRLTSCWISQVPIPIIIQKLLHHHYLDFRRINERLLDALWREDREAFAAFVDALSKAETTCRWKDPAGTIRTEAKIKLSEEMSRAIGRDVGSIRVSGVSKMGVFDANGNVAILTAFEYLHEMQPLHFSTILALKMHTLGDFQNFGRIVAMNPEVVWGELKGLKPGAIFEEEGMHAILNEIVRDIVKTAGKLDPLNRRYLARDMFADFTEYHAAQPKKDKDGKDIFSSWVKNKVHDPKDTGKDQFISKDDDASSSAFQDYMTRAISLDNLGPLTDNIHGSAFLTAIVFTGALRYAAGLKDRDKADVAELDFYFTAIFAGLKAGLSAAPLYASALGNSMDFFKDVVVGEIDRSTLWRPRDIADAVGQILVSFFYNPAVDGYNVPGLGEKFLCLDEDDPYLFSEQERRMELGRRYAEMSHRYLADLLPNMSLWSTPAPHLYIPETIYLPGRFQAPGSSVRIR